MQLAWQTHRSPLNEAAQRAVDELWHRFRAFNGLPVQLMVVTPGTRRPGLLQIVYPPTTPTPPHPNTPTPHTRPGSMPDFDVYVFTRSRKALTWVWLAYDCLTDRQRMLLRVLPYTLAEAKKDAYLADFLRAHLGWEKPEYRHRRRRAKVVEEDRP